MLFGPGSRINKDEQSKGEVSRAIETLEKFFGGQVRIDMPSLGLEYGILDEPEPENCCGGACCNNDEVKEPTKQTNAPPLYDFDVPTPTRPVNFARSFFIEEADNGFIVEIEDYEGDFTFVTASEAEVADWLAEWLCSDD